MIIKLLIKIIKLIKNKVFKKKYKMLIKYKIIKNNFK